MFVSLVPGNDSIRIRLGDDVVRPGSRAGRNRYGDVGEIKIRWRKRRHDHAPEFQIPGLIVASVDRYTLVVEAPAVNTPTFLVPTPNVIVDPLVTLVEGVKAAPDVKSGLVSLIMMDMLAVLFVSFVSVTIPSASALAMM